VLIHAAPNRVNPIFQAQFEYRILNDDWVLYQEVIMPRGKTKKILVLCFLVMLCTLLVSCQSLPEPIKEFTDSVTGQQDHLAVGQAAFDKEDYDQAIDELTQAIDDKPDDAFIYYLRGQAYYNRYKVLYEVKDTKADGNDFYRAITDFTKAIELSNNYAVAYNYRGLAYAGLKMNEHALADYNMAIQLDPDGAATYYGRAYLYETLSEWDKAVVDYTVYISITDDDYWRTEAEKRLKEIKNR